MKYFIVHTENIIVAPHIKGYEINYKYNDEWYYLLLKGSDADLFERLWGLVNSAFPQWSAEKQAFYVLSFGYSASAQSERI